MAEKEYLLGNKARDLYQYTKQVTRPVPDDKVEAKDVAMVMRKMAGAQTLEEMRANLNATAERLEKRRGRRRFPKSETFNMIADLRGAAREILKGVRAANETNFNTEPATRLREIKAVIDDCGLMLDLVELSHELEYIDMKRMAAWTKKITDVKYMCLSWLKKDTARAKIMRINAADKETERLVRLVREIIAADQETRI